jgi:hypothetical protein
MTIKDSVFTVGSNLSNVEKLPCSSFNLSAGHCKTGAKLVKVKGSVCDGCYALGGNYQRFGHIESMKPKTALINSPQWVGAMAHLISTQNKGDTEYFRWHDSGDIQSVSHLCKIVEVCNLTPTVSHWLPTREYKFVKDYLKIYGNFPVNLMVRLSAHMVDQLPPNIQGTTGSAVSDKETPKGFLCPAPTQGGKCVDCRACWSKKEPLVTYHKH